MRFMLVRISLRVLLVLSYTTSDDLIESEGVSRVAELPADRNAEHMSSVFRNLGYVFLVSMEPE